MQRNLTGIVVTLLFLLALALSAPIHAQQERNAKPEGSMTIYVGNLDYNLSEDEIRAAFEAYGEVASVRIVRDADTGQPRGFGYVVMTNPEEGHKAIIGLNGFQLGSRILHVNETRPDQDK
jgi:cold-inducible RNA-binding protein